MDGMYNLLGSLWVEKDERQVMACEFHLVFMKYWRAGIYTWSVFHVQFLLWIEEGIVLEKAKVYKDFRCSLGRQYHWWYRVYIVKLIIKTFFSDGRPKDNYLSYRRQRMSLNWITDWGRGLTRVIYCFKSSFNEILMKGRQWWKVSERSLKKSYWFSFNWW